MKRVFDKKIIFGFILGGMVFSSIGVLAAYIYDASNISYNNTDVKSAIDQLYDSAYFGDATSADILSGKTALAGGKKITGTLTAGLITQENVSIKDVIIGSSVQNINSTHYHDIYITFPRAINSTNVRVTAHGSASYTSLVGCTPKYVNGQCVGFTAHGVYIWRPDGNGLDWGDTTISYIAVAIN